MFICYHFSKIKKSLEYQHISTKWMLKISKTVLTSLIEFQTFQNMKKIKFSSLSCRRPQGDQHQTLKLIFLSLSLVEPNAKYVNQTNFDNPNKWLLSFFFSYWPKLGVSDITIPQAIIVCISFRIYVCMVPGSLKRC